MLDLTDFWKGFWTGAGVLVAIFIAGRVFAVV